MRISDSLCFICLGLVENCLELRGTDDIDSDNLFSTTSLKYKFLQVWEMGKWESFSWRFGLCSDLAYNQEWYDSNDRSHP